MVLESFFDYLSDIKKYSSHTLVAYREDLKQFDAYCNTINDIRDINDVTSKIIRNWVILKMSEGMTPTTVRRKISTLKTYFKYLLHEGIIENDPCEMVVMPKKGEKLPVFLHDYQMNEILDNEESDGSFSAVRDRLVILTAYLTGMRRSELVSLKVSELDFSSKHIVVTGKGAKQRLIPLVDELIEEMKYYLELRRDVVRFDHDIFFVTDKGKPAYDKFIYRLVVKYLRRFTTLSKVSPHVLRHTFATNLLNNGACIEAIRELLGHSDLSATQVYTHNSFEQLVKAYNQAHPRA
ncbi:MAG: tyrosine-type recombinase/integrase [Culturomica sp.]|jgi:integrase/recombinase XerC|nr:tyrosine-type recombinase/integrase [Culturomica sp.]